MVKKLLNILYLMVLNLLYFSGGFLLWEISLDLLDGTTAGFCLMLIEVIFIIFLIASSNYFIYKSFFHSTIKKELYIGVCVVEYAAIVLSLFRLLLKIAG